MYAICFKVSMLNSDLATGRLSLSSALIIFLYICDFFLYFVWMKAMNPKHFQLYVISTQPMHKYIKSHFPYAVMYFPAKK